MNKKSTVVIVSLSMLMSLAVSAAGRPLLSGHEQRITTLEGQTSTLAIDIATITLTPGPQGDKGDKGAAGQPGAKGDAGVAGAKGIAGAKGDMGEAGSNGQNGKEGIGAIAGTDVGQMQYWDGDTWEVINAPTADSQVLTFVNGAFIWNDPTF
jgi:hypothetical protein